MRTLRRPSSASYFALAFVTLAVLVVPSGASAALIPGTPVPVEPGVPDQGRAWELVTPPDPIGTEQLAPRAIAADGNAFAILASGPLPGSSSGVGLFTINLAHRKADGWVSSSLAPPYPEAEDILSTQGPSAFSPDLSDEIWSGRLPLASPEAPQAYGLFRRTNGGPFSLLTTTTDTNPNSSNPFLGASADLQHALFTSDTHLLPSDATRTGGKSLYEVSGSSLRLVDVGDDGSLLSNCGSTVQEAGSPVSRDGRRIFFVTHPSCSGPARAYMREDGLTTVMISASECTLVDCGSEADTSILGATPSGSSAFITTAEKLTNDDSDDSVDLYRYDVADGQLTLLSPSPVANPVAPLTPGSRSLVLQTSDDGSRALFWVTGPSADDERSLYLATPTGPRLISPSAGSFVQLSPTGRFALFATKAQLAAGDTDEGVDVYRFDADTNTTTWISDGPIGGNGAFDVTINSDLTELSLSSHPYRAMSDNGSDIFFGTAERLVSQDRNNVANVYEWKDGSLGLVSPGSGDLPSYYQGATPDGSSVFLRTALTLLPRDRDGGDLDFYVARVGGGFPEPPSQPAPCRDDACLPPLSGRLSRPEPDSAKRHEGIHIQEVSRKARRRIAKTGKIELLAEVASGGSLTAQARAQMGGRRRVVASTRLKVAHPGAVRLAMPLSAEARHALAGGRDLHVQVVLRLSRSSAARRIEFVLDGRGGR